jgi:hypothetical protein
VLSSIRVVEMYISTGLHLLTAGTRSTTNTMYTFNCMRSAKGVSEADRFTKDFSKEVLFFWLGFAYSDSEGRRFGSTGLLEHN